MVCTAQIENFLHPAFSASHMQHVWHLHPKFALRPHHVWKYGRHQICNGWEQASKKRRKIERRNHRTKIQWPAVFHRAATKNRSTLFSNVMHCKHSNDVTECKCQLCQLSAWVILKMWICKMYFAKFRAKNSCKNSVKCERQVYAKSHSTCGCVQT